MAKLPEDELDSELDKANMRAEAMQTALTQCLLVNPDNPLAVAETIKEAFALLYSIKELSQGYSFPYDEVNRAVGNLLAKANKKGE